MAIGNKLRPLLLLSSVIVAYSSFTSLAISHDCTPPLTINHDRRMGGNGIGIQGFSLNYKTKRLYTLELNGKSAGNFSTVRRYEIVGDLAVRPIIVSFSPAVGHQGLVLSPLSNPTMLWSTSRNDKRSAISVELASGKERTVKLYNDEFSPSVSSTPSISVDGRLFIAQGQRRDQKGTAVIRIWRMRDIQNSQGVTSDLSDAWIYEWPAAQIVDSEHPLQGIFGDGSTITLLSGNGSLEQTKRLYQYSLKGELLSKEDDVHVGRESAVLDGGRHYEPEGLSGAETSSGDVRLFIAFSSGSLGARITRLYDASCSF